MSTSVAHLNSIAHGPTGTGTGTGTGEPNTMGEATAPLMRFLLNGRNASFFATWYASEAVCLGMFRLLPPIPRQLVMALIWSATNFRAKDIKALIKLHTHASHADFERRISPLVALGILSINTHKGIPYVHMHPGFRHGLRNALANGGKSNAFGVSYVVTENDGSVEPPPSVEELVEHGNNVWEGMLKYMVSSRLDAPGSDSDRPEQAVLDLLLESGLMSEATNKRSGRFTLQITSKGFQFLLEDRLAQIWQVLMYYVGIKTAKARHGGDDGVEILKLFFTLGNMQLGRAYSASALPAAQSPVLDDLEAYGLIYRRPALPSGKRHDQFYPTGLATTLCAGSGAVDGGVHEGGKGFLILETNYKVYAYTSNELEIAILNLFVDIRVRYPNLIVGKLERDTVKRAMEEGITASQIISYLSTHAHPQMQKNNPLLPITVVDQLHLWDKERNRLNIDEGVLFKLRQKHLYEDAVSHAKTLGSLIYHSDANRQSTGFVGNVFVSTFAAGPLRDYLNARRAEHEMY
ncbi:RNA polymerase II transcription factor B 52 kDa subunit [Naganishia albida]|nr:RNA polymerase II transcription factor B 52 kDa subunit [Naganishia albida]